MKTLVVVPTRNSEKTILKTISDLETHAPEFDYVVIDMGSTDRTKYLLDNNSISRLEFSVESEYYDTVSLSLLYAYQNDYDAVIEYDDTGIFDPRDLYYLERTYQNNNTDFVFASRYVKKGPMFHRNPGNWIMRLASWLIIHNKISDPLMRYKLYGKNVIKLFGDHSKNKFNPSPDRILQSIKSGNTYCEIGTKLNNKSGHQSKHKGIAFWFAVVGWVLSVLFSNPFKRSKRRKYE